jgi:hypothetical protein
MKLLLTFTGIEIENNIDEVISEAEWKKLYV